MSPKPSGILLRVNLQVERWLRMTAITVMLS
jgi:hypothetical protein